MNKYLRNIRYLKDDCENILRIYKEFERNDYKGDIDIERAERLVVDFLSDLSETFEIYEDKCINDYNFQDDYPSHEFLWGNIQFHWGIILGSRLTIISMLESQEDDAVRIIYPFIVKNQIDSFEELVRQLGILL